MYEKSLLIVKPEGVTRGLIGKIITRFEDCGLKVHAMRFEVPKREVVEAHYDEHVGKPFFPSIVGYMSSGPVVVFVLGGVSCVAKIRQIVGATTPTEAAPGTIRGDFAHQDKDSGKDRPIYNLIHASANVEDANREIDIWFKPEEVIEYDAPCDYFHGR